jgi:hypothetical protein
MAQGRPMMRTSEAIGALLDAAMEFALRVRITDLSESTIARPSASLSTPERAAIATALLAEHLRNDVNGKASEACECGRSALLARLSTPETILEPLPIDRPGPSDAPDLALVDHRNAVIAAFSVHYGWWPDRARDEIDRLLAHLWRGGPLRLVGHIFVHETWFGEIIRETERGIEGWIGTNYGPINGIDRIQLPLSPRIVRTGKAAPPSGATVSKIDGSTRPTGFAAFALVCETERY